MCHIFPKIHVFVFSFISYQISEPLFQGMKLAKKKLKCSWEFGMFVLYIGDYFGKYLCNL